MCWFLLIAIVAWLVLVFTATIFIFWHTQNYFISLVFTPLASPTYLLYRVLLHLLPLLSEKGYQLEKMKIQMLPKIQILPKVEKPDKTTKAEITQDELY